MVFLIDAIKQENHDTIILDLSKTASIDSAIIGTLLAIHQGWKKKHGTCTIHCSIEVKKILAMMGVDIFLLGENHE